MRFLSKSNEDVGWASDDHLRFEYILDQYDANMPQRRTLYIDRLMRELPHLSRHDIVSLLFFADEC